MCACFKEVTRQETTLKKYIKKGNIKFNLKGKNQKLRKQQNKSIPEKKSSASW